MSSTIPSMLKHLKGEKTPLGDSESLETEEDFFFTSSVHATMHSFKLFINTG